MATANQDAVKNRTADQHAAIGDTEPTQEPDRRAAWMRWLISWTIFPIVYVAAHWGVVAWMQIGYGPGATVAVVSTVVAVVLMLLEYLQPHFGDWHRSQGDVPTDLAHLVFSTMLVPAAFNALFLSLLLVGATWLSSTFGIGLWPHQLPIALELLVALVVAELGVYWWHRMCHEHEALWRFHATHHSSRRLYWLNSCRFHPIDSLAQYAVEVSPLILLGCDREVLALFTLSTAVIGMFQHANVELRLGPLNWFFSMTELHRWHHSQEIGEGNSNYGANLIVWDVVFGTRFLPTDRVLPADQVGIRNMPNFPRDYVGQLLSPIRWKRLRGNAARQSPRR